METQIRKWLRNVLDWWTLWARWENVFELARFSFEIQFISSLPQPGDFLIRNETIESKCVLYHWPRVHRLEYKIQNHDDLLSFAQIEIIDNDVGERHIEIYDVIDFFPFSRSHTRFTSTLYRIIMKFWLSAPRKSEALSSSTTKRRRTFTTSRHFFPASFPNKTHETTIKFKDWRQVVRS